MSFRRFCAEGKKAAPEADNGKCDSFGIETDARAAADGGVYDRVGDDQSELF